ncbi:MAG: hypothetical protein NTU89_03245 [Candidatus Dependentiae bacterium]|nr:hypothetical protein [Candidatus Dependentiae bacterium]
MKRFFMCCFLTISTIHLSVQSSVFKTKKIKEPSVQDIKIQLAQNLQDLLLQTTSSIRSLTHVADDVAKGIKELAGQCDGLLSGNDKEAIKEYQKRVFLLQKSLMEIDIKI